MVYIGSIVEKSSGFLVWRNSKFFGPVTSLFCHTFTEYKVLSVGNGVTLKSKVYAPDDL